MPTGTKTLIRDFNNMPVPQMFNIVEDQFEALSGANGAVNVLPRNELIWSPPITGAKTIGTGVQELYAGASRVSNRQFMMVYNEGNEPVYFGGNANITVGTGFPLLPGNSVKFGFYPSVTTPIYFVASADQSVRVLEMP